MSEPIVFVIDDEAPSREVLVELVKTMQLPVRSFASAEDFVAAYQGERPA